MGAPGEGKCVRRAEGSTCSAGRTTGPPSKESGAEERAALVARDVAFGDRVVVEELVELGHELDEVAISARCRCQHCAGDAEAGMLVLTRGRTRSSPMTVGWLPGRRFVRR